MLQTIILSLLAMRHPPASPPARLAPIEKWPVMDENAHLAFSRRAGNW